MKALEEGMRFSGTLSLENNGGFASVRSRGIEQLSPKVTALVIKVMGDGRTYDFDVRDANRRGAFSYRQRFDTVDGEITEVRLPFGGFTATSFGRPIPSAAPIRPENVRSIGITLADKKPGAFQIDLLEVKAIESEPEAVMTPSAVALIDQAISFGVPEYNNGNPAGCARIYEVTLMSFLVKDHPEVSPERQASLRTAMSSLPEDMDERAWALRRELDQLRRAISQGK